MGPDVDEILHGCGGTRESDLVRKGSAEVVIDGVEEF